MNRLNLKGRTAVVTGGMQGIGAAIVKRVEDSSTKAGAFGAPDTLIRCDARLKREMKGS